MQTSEASDAGAAGFGTGNGKHDRRLRQFRTSIWGRIAARLTTPLTLAVATTAFASASLFVIYDTAATLGSVKREMSLIGAALSARLADEPSANLDLVLAGTIGDFPGVMNASFVTAAPTADLPFNAVVPAGVHGLLSVEAEQAGAISGIAGRATGAFALAGLFTALTMRRRRDKAMPDPMQRHGYQTLASAIPMGVACWTEAGEMIVCNENYRTRLRLDTGRVNYSQALSRLLAGGYMKLVRDDAPNRLLELHQQDGSCLLIDERPLPDGSLMTLVSDVTERKRTDLLLTTIREEQRQLARRYHEEKLKAEAANRAKTNFLAHLSHDIRTPLNHIIGFAELMGHQTYGALGDERYVDYVQSIKISGEHLLHTFAAILDLAELENGQKVLRTDPVPVDEVLDSVERRFRGQIKRAGLKLSLHAECGAVLRGDRLALVRMVGNILENAIRFTPAGGTLTLATFAADDGIVIEISDTGIGMDQDRLSSLSQPFALGDASFTRDGVGPGLGVSISRAIAELSGGRMVIDSTPAVGTTVAISLPLETAYSEVVAAE